MLPYFYTLIMKQEPKSSLIEQLQLLYAQLTMSSKKAINPKDFFD